MFLLERMINSRKIDTRKKKGKKKCSQIYYMYTPLRQSLIYSIIVLSSSCSGGDGSKNNDSNRIVVVMRIYRKLQAVPDVPRACWGLLGV